MLEGQHIAYVLGAILRINFVVKVFQSYQTFKVISRVFFAKVFLYFHEKNSSHLHSNKIDDLVYLISKKIVKISILRRESMYMLKIQEVCDQMNHWAPLVTLLVSFSAFTAEKLSSIVLLVEEYFSFIQILFSCSVGLFHQLIFLYLMFFLI